MAPVGVPGAAANVVANGGTIYNGLVQTVRKSADYDVLTAEALEAVLNMFGRAKTKAAFRDRSAELAHRMVAEGLTIWEDLRGVDLAWLEKTVGVPHFEALAFFRFLDDSAQEEEDPAPAASWAAELEEELEDLEGQMDDHEAQELLDDIVSATSEERREEREDEQQQQQQQQQQQRRQPRKGADPKRFGRDDASGGTTHSGNPPESQLSVAESLSEMARTITEGQQAIQAAAKHASRAQVPVLERGKEDYQLPSVRTTVGWIKQVKRIFADVAGLQEGVEAMLLDPMGTVAADVVVQDPGEHVCRLVQASMDSVWEDMGGGERRHVGALLLNTLQKAIKKKIKVQARESTCTALEDFEVVTGPSQLKTQWEAWFSLVWEVRYSEFYTDDTLRQSARRVFQRFQPMLEDAT